MTFDDVVVDLLSGDSEEEVECGGEAFFGSGEGETPTVYKKSALWKEVTALPDKPGCMSCNYCGKVLKVNAGAEGRPRLRSVVQH